MYKYNSKHGTPYTNDQKRLFAIEMAREDNKTDKEIAETLGVSRQTVNKWTRTLKIKKRSELTKKIIDLRINHGYTQTKISEILNIPQRTVSYTLSKNAQDSKVANIKKPSEIFKTNHWGLQGKKYEKIDKYSGKTDEIQLENLLYYHTEPKNKVIDLFAGSGTLFDVCDRMERDCQLYCLNQFAGREHIIKKWNIKNGIPPDMPVKTHLLFFDPPYWKQKNYTVGDADDLSNMSLDDYNTTIQNLFNKIKNSHVNDVYILKIAILIAPTIYIDGQFTFEDHMFDFHDMIKDKYEIIARYSLYYNSEGRLRLDAQRHRKCVTVLRDLIVYELRR